MKTPRILLCALLFSGVLAGAGSAATSASVGLHIGPSGRATVDLGFFYDDLASYGNWVERPQYGWVWRPRAVATTWRPYQNGHWAWTDEGWIWITDEPYGWATYHYGRWYDDPEYGWEWVPGDEYAPAWVSWQEGSDYIGWAPLPPSVEFHAGALTVSLAPEAYVFVPTRRFLDPQPFRYAVPRQDCARVYRQTRSFTEYQVVNQRVVNRGVPVEQIQRVVGRPVPRYHIAEVDANQRHHGARIAQNRVTVFRPQVQKAQVAPPPQRPAARRAVLTAPPPTAPNGRASRAPHAARNEPAAQQPARPNRQPRQVQPESQEGRPNQHQGRGRGGRGVADQQPPQAPPQGQADRRPHQQQPAGAGQEQQHPNRRQQREQQRPQQNPPPQDQNRHQGRGQRQNQPHDQGQPQPHGQGHGNGHNKPKDNGDNRPPA